jgi:hypothetical protein
MSRVLNAIEKSNPSALTANGAISYGTVGFSKGAACLEYFSKCGTYVDRPQSAVDADMVKIFSDDPEAAIKIVFGTRLISRAYGEDAETQTGFGRRDEFYKCVNWLKANRPTLLSANLHLIPIFGCWKDFLNEPLIDTLERKSVYGLFKENLDNDLLRKYLPTIRGKRREWSKADRQKMRKLGVTKIEGAIRVNKELSVRDAKRVAWAKGFCKFLGISKKEYRAIKSSGKAHIFQKQMSGNLWDKINFNGVAGKAMFLATSQKGYDKQSVFERHGQVVRLLEWLKTQKTVKFTGYIYELLKAAKTNPSIIQKLTYDLQFETILEQMKNHKLGNVLAALDTSGSMSIGYIPNISPLYIGLSLGIAFSAMNVGYFKDTVCMFDSDSSLLKLHGGFCDRVKQVPSDAMGSTNFQSVIDLLVNTRKQNSEIPVNEYPETLLVISDMQFNPTEYNYRTGKTSITNYEDAKRKLNEVGLGEMRIIWWNVNGNYSDFPSTMDDKGIYMISGFDPTNIKSLMGLNQPKVLTKAIESATIMKEVTTKVEENPLDGLNNWLSQSIFSLVKTTI